jgi:hypothetical protein
MRVFDDGTFRPLLIVPGEEAVQVVERVGKLVQGDARR